MLYLRPMHMTHLFPKIQDQFMLLLRKLQPIC